MKLAERFSNLIGDGPKTKKYILGAVLFLFVIVYNFVWINKTFVLAVNWDRYYSELISQGLVPYKDFYYFLPPLSLLEDYLIWKLSFGYLLVYRIWRLLQRALIIELIYMTVQKRVSPYVSFLCGILTTVLVSANNYDLGGDYNQTQQLLIFLCGIIVLEYIDATVQKRGESYTY